MGSLRRPDTTGTAATGRPARTPVSEGYRRRERARVPDQADLGRRAIHRIIVAVAGSELGEIRRWRRWSTRSALDERLAQLEAARSWSPRVVSRLESLIRDGDDAALFRVNPFALAAERGLDPAEATDLMLHATAQGLFEMDWLLICPRCACAVESFAKLRAVLRQFRCPQCHNEYEAAMDDYIAIYFNVSPQIAPPLSPAGDARSVRLHLPLPRRARGPPPERRALHRFHPRGDARGRVHGAARHRQLRVRRRAGRVSGGVSADTEAGFALRITGEPVTETRHGPADLSRRQLRAGGADAGAGAGPARDREPDRAADRRGGGAVPARMPTTSS